MTANEEHDRGAVLAAYNHDERRYARVAAPGYACQWDGSVVRITGPDARPWSNTVLFADLENADIEHAIARQIEHYSRLGHAFEWKLHDYDRPLDLGDRLRDAGFSADPVETLVAYDVSRDFASPDVADEIDFVRLEDPAAFGPLAQLSAEVYGDPDHGAWVVQSLVNEKRAAPQALSIEIARVGDQVIAAGWIRFPTGSRFASLWGGSTLPEWRRMGVYSALVARRLAMARARHYRWLTVDCSPMSLPTLERRGFQRLAVITPWIWRPPSAR